MPLEWYIPCRSPRLRFFEGLSQTADSKCAHVTGLVLWDVRMAGVVWVQTSCSIKDPSIAHLTPCIVLRWKINLADLERTNNSRWWIKSQSVGISFNVSNYDNNEINGCVKPRFEIKSETNVDVFDKSDGILHCWSHDPHFQRWSNSDKTMDGVLRLLKLEYWARSDK